MTIPVTTPVTSPVTELPPELLTLLATLRPHDGPTHNPHQWTLDTRLDDLGIDSLDRIRLAVALEATLGTAIPDAALSDVDHLADLADLLTRRRAPDATTTSCPATEAAFPAPPSTRTTNADDRGDDRGDGDDGGDGFVHPTAELGDGASIGPGSKVWHHVQIAAGVQVGAQCTLGKAVYLGTGTRVGDRVKIQNAVNVFGADLHDEVMLCPGVLLVEDPTPRAVTTDGARQEPGDWVARPVTVHRGATIGAGAILLPGVQIGAHAMVAAGSVVDHDVPPHALVAGTPHRQIGWVCRCGHRLIGGRCIRCAAPPTDAQLPGVSRE
jgi:acetyltransferase-like isoleucine patch superfamily enzyme/acyl carrier protein